MSASAYDRMRLLVVLAAMGRLRIAYRAACADPLTGTGGIDATIESMSRAARIGGPRPLEAT